MKLLLGSDLHLEFEDQKKLPELPEHDLLVLAGDIDKGTAGLRWAKDKAKGPTLYVPGNHEYYGYGKQSLDAVYYDFEDENVMILNPGTYETEEVVFIGCPLYSCLQLPGYTYHAPVAYSSNIGDFYVTPGWNADMHIAYHKANVQFIALELDKYRDKKCVVITHWLPSMQCIDKFFEGNLLNPYFANDLDWLIDEFKPAMWLFGHTHSKVDKIHSNGITRLVCNPRGYPAEKPRAFKWKEMEL